MVTPDKIVYSNRKTLSISVDVFGRLTVRAPRRYSRERIDAFLKEKEGWIYKKQAERKGAGMRLPPENLHGYVFSLLGEDAEIRLYEGEKIAFEKEKGLLYLPEKKSRERLVKWLKENAKRILSTVTAQWAATMQVSYRSVTITSARTRWGCCTAENALRYTFRLLYCPREIIEYVVVHELAHTLQKNHSPQFWREVEKYIPDWRARRKWLKAHGIFMEIF